MATTAQKKALEAAQQNMAYTKSNQEASKSTYQNAYSNYKNAVSQSYSPSQQTTAYKNASDKALSAASAMGDFQYDSKRTGDIERLLGEAENMKFNFNYSLTDDPAYQSMRDEYVHNGQMAALDAAGNMVGQTGGFGSTAATAASQQAYNESLTQLNGAVPDLYNAAYNRQWNEFTNQRDTLQQLASAYQSLDQQEYDQALSTWTNNFNQYITIAEEYQSKYEYMDSAERAQYEAELDGLWNLLTSAQEQYISDMGAYTDSLINYSDTAMGIANYEETKRQFDANLAYKKSSSSDDDDNSTYKYTANSLVNSYSRVTGRGNSTTINGKKVNSIYTKDSLLKDITAKYNNKEISADDYASLLSYYGLA